MRPQQAAAAAAGAVAAMALMAAIYAGSGGLLTFDSALVGYAVAIVFLTFGVVYRYTLWVQSPPARRLLVRGWRGLLSWRNFARFPTLAPRALVESLTFQRFIGARGKGRWVAHQLVFWRVALTTVITFPLVFGWIHFQASPGPRPRYVLHL
jgi:hypothetical protein